MPYFFFSQNKRPHAIYYSGLKKNQSADENEWFHYFYADQFVESGLKRPINFFLFRVNVKFTL